MATKRKKTIFERLEKTTTLLRLIVVGGSGYLLYRKFQKDKLEDQLLAQQRRAAAMAAEGASQDLIGPGVKVLPSSGAQPVAYQGASSDQVDTARQLTAPQAKNLDPNEVAAQALTSLVSSATNRLTS